MPDRADLPTALTDRIAFQLQLALAQAQRMGEQALVPLGIAGREYGVLALLQGDGGRVQHALGATLGIDRTTTMTLVARLEGRGLVRRTKDPADRRAYLVRLTPAGERLRAAAADVLRDCDDRFASSLSDADRRRLRGMLQKLADA